MENIKTSVEICLHFLLQPQKKIKVDTSVCTGISNMPPAYCILGLRISNARKRKKQNELMLILLFWSECRDSNSKQCCTSCGIACGGCPHSLSASRKPLGDGNQEASSSSVTAKEKDRKSKSLSCLFGPSVEIRTRGLLNPIQARYQTSPHPDICLHASAPQYISTPY